jgi:hypothetical protein
MDPKNHVKITVQLLDIEKKNVKSSIFSRWLPFLFFPFFVFAFFPFLIFLKHSVSPPLTVVV